MGGTQLSDQQKSIQSKQIQNKKEGKIILNRTHDINA